MEGQTNQDQTVEAHNSRCNTLERGHVSLLHAYLISLSDPLRYTDEGNTNEGDDAVDEDVQHGKDSGCD